MVLNPYKPKMPKNTPQTSSSRTPESRTKGLSARSRKRPMPWRIPRSCRTTGLARRVVTEGSSLRTAWLGVSSDTLRLGGAGRLVLTSGPFRDGLSARAASIAWANVFAADLAPKPSARPNRTVSMSSVYRGERVARKRWADLGRRRASYAGEREERQNEERYLDGWRHLRNGSRVYPLGIDPETKRGGIGSQARRCLGRPSYEGLTRRL